MDIDIILQKARKAQGLESDEVKFLFENLENLESASQIATKLRLEKKGNFATFYTCLYITNSCINNCKYCGYRNSNKDLKRITITSEQLVEEAKAIKDLGISNIILIGGTMPENQYKELIIKGTKTLLDLNLIPWIEFENLSPEILKDISNTGAKHFVLFQETYDKKKYEKIHDGNSLKKDYYSRLKKVDEALESGFININIGALLGLNEDYVSEVIGLYNHAKRLQQNGANVCISIPTLKPAPGVSISLHKVSEKIIEKAYTVLRLALPNISLSLSGRESQELRNKLFPIIDQIGTSGVPNPGGRTVYKDVYNNANTQFVLNDQRSPQEIIKYLAKIGIKIKHQLEWN